MNELDQYYVKNSLNLNLYNMPVDKYNEIKDSDVFLNDNTTVIFCYSSDYVNCVIEEAQDMVLELFRNTNLIFVYSNEDTESSILTVQPGTNVVKFEI